MDSRARDSQRRSGDAAQSGGRPLRAKSVKRLVDLAKAFNWTEELESVCTRLDVAVPAADPAPALPDRYEDLGLLGRGGQGQVRLVCDHRLGRLAALKLLSRADHEPARARFSAESSITAALEHPGVVPIYDRGVTADGRPWYAMRYVEGRTLGQAIREARPLRRLVDALVRVCEALAYAHHRDVVHLDVKPDNILLGPFGEVLITDWGLARRVGELTPKPGLGTPAYMPYEQSVGGLPAAPAADVFALGSTLLHVLRGAPPNHMSVAHRGPQPLCELVRAARSDDAEARPADAAAFGDRLRRWLDGEARRDAAEALLIRAAKLAPRLERLRTRARTLADRAEALLDPVPSYAPTQDKLPGWRLADEADALLRQARRLELDRVGLLRRAVEAAPEYDEARGQLIEYHRGQVVLAEAADDEAAVDQHSATLWALDPEGQLEWLEGDGRLQIATDVPAEAWLSVLNLRARRWQPVPLGPLGPTPIDVSLPRGRYQVVLRAPGRQPVIYPVLVARRALWNAVAPGETAPTPIPLPPPLGDDQCYVPPGWFIAGGDERAVDATPRRRVWVDGFVIQRDPVSNADFLAYLNAQVDADRRAEAERHAPAPGGSPCYGRTPDGHFVLDERDGGRWPLDGPVAGLRPSAAMAYAAWRSALDGVRWRLPDGLEWEKAARGVDGRVFPMGDYLDPTWACVVGRLPGAARVMAFEANPLDRSPYGVRGLAGNVRDICGNRYVRGGRKLDGARLDPVAHAGTSGHFEVRGGSLSSPVPYCRAAGRFGISEEARATVAGFRLVRPWPG